MRTIQFIDVYINKLVERINTFNEQWKGTRFAAIDDSGLVPEDEDEI